MCIRDSFEFNVTNNIVQKERFRYFIKVPELAAFYNEITATCHGGEAFSAYLL